MIPWSLFWDPTEHLGTYKKIWHRFQWGSNGVPIGAPMGLQWGEMGENNLGDFGFVSELFIVFSGGFGVYIIRKWLISDS